MREWDVFVTVSLQGGRLATWHATVFSPSARQARHDGRQLLERVLPDYGARLAAITVEAAPSAPRIA